jgi:hypothetical protein
MLDYKMRKSGSKSRSSRKTKRKSSKGASSLSEGTLRQIVKLGVTGMVAMYVATIIVNVGAVSAIAGKVAKIIGISKSSVMYAAKGTGVAGIALRLHKEL